MEARVKLLGHPAHQMLIVLPLGLLLGAVLFDVLYYVTGWTGFATASFWNIAGGVVTGLVSAVFGLLDWSKIPRGTRAKRVGAIHGIGNAILLVLFTGSWLLRYNEPFSAPTTVAFALEIVAAALGGVTGWLGGELVTRLGVGVHEGANLNAPSSLSSKPASPTSQGGSFPGPRLVAQGRS